MNPLLLGGAALVALLALSSSSSASASQDQMVFKDYMWTTTLPATLPIANGLIESTLLAAAQAGQWPAPSPLAAELPAPPNASATGGKWAHYPCGWAKTNSGGAMVASVFPGCPGTVDVYAWIPNFSWNPNNPSVLPVTQINGYYVTMAPNVWSDKADGSTGPSGPGVFWTVGQAGWPPPPPGQSSGHWYMRAPGYCVWLTSANANTGELASYAFNLGTAVPTTAAAPSSFLSSL